MGIIATTFIEAITRESMRDFDLYEDPAEAYDEAIGYAANHKLYRDAGFRHPFFIDGTAERRRRYERALRMKVAMETKDGRAFLEPVDYKRGIVACVVAKRIDRAA